MREELLHFIWQYRYFNNRELRTEAGEQLFIHYPGEPNTNQGPDFRNARITIGDTTGKEADGREGAAELEGAVELHLKTSDWIRHGHTGDPHFQQVILHVVWENDTVVPPSGIPILVLRDRVPRFLLPRYMQFMASQSFVPCEPLLPADIDWPVLKERLLHRRLASRTAFIRTLLDEYRPHWEEITFQLIARSLGQPVNAAAFLAVARSIPLNRLLRRRTDPDYLEGLFLARAAHLDPPLSFFRVRPAHSPNARFRQLAAILSKHRGWFTPLLESDHPAPVLHTLDAEGLGAETKRSILINAHIPLLFAYGTLRQEPGQCDKALRWLHETPPENNHIIRCWRRIGMTARTAADSQALLELRKQYCIPKKCLDCAIGQALLTSPADELRRGCSATPSPRSYPSLRSGTA